MRAELKLLRRPHVQQGGKPYAIVSMLCKENRPGNVEALLPIVLIVPDCDSVEPWQSQCARMFFLIIARASDCCRVCYVGAISARGCSIASTTHLATLRLGQCRVEGKGPCVGPLLLRLELFLPLLPEMYRASLLHNQARPIRKVCLGIRVL